MIKKNKKVNSEKMEPGDPMRFYPDFILIICVYIIIIIITIIIIIYIHMIIYGFFPWFLPSRANRWRRRVFVTGEFCIQSWKDSAFVPQKARGVFSE